MTSPNDSVLICDSPSPSNSNAWMDTVTNYRKRLRSSRNFKTVFDTVYESPLIHLKRNIASTNKDSDITVVMPHLANGRKIDATAKRRKKNLDQSVVILNDSSLPVVEIGLSDTETNDVVEVSETLQTNRTPKTRLAKRNFKRSVGVTPIKNLSAKRRIERLLRKKDIEPGKLKVASNTAVTSGVNDENHNGQIMRKSVGSENEDIEVVWVSNENPESTSQQTAANADESFVIDTEPTFENLTKTAAFRAKKLKRLEGRVKKTKSHKKINNRRTLGYPSDRGNVRIPEDHSRLREIVIDGSNVAMGHNNGKSFSEKGLQIVINYFKERGHVVKAFLPQSTRARDRDLLEKLHKSGYVVFTPSRRIGGRKITPYDDRFILEYATECNGIVVSSDQYRDLWHEKPQWRDTIENRLLTPTFVGDYLMFPEDPLGRTGPKLEEFLRY